MINPINKVVNKFGTDKVLHFLCGAVIAFVADIISFALVDVTETNKFFNIVFVGLILSIFTGFGKEFTDDKFDIKDAVVTVFGGLFAVVIFIITWFI